MYVDPFIFVEAISLAVFSVAQAGSTNTSSSIIAISAAFFLSNIYMLVVR